jgi:centrosomal protein POC5
VPQVIDEDTEQFKVRLEHILNVFKTEATSEFMTMKRSMLEDQKNTIKFETEKYMQMYEDKCTELLHNKA